MLKRLAPFALIASALVACNDAATAPATPTTLNAATLATASVRSQDLPTLACPTASPTAEINAIIVRINSSNLSPAVKAQITASLQQALTALANRDLSAAALAIQTAIETLQASPAPAPVRSAVSTLLNCVLSLLSA